MIPSAKIIFSATNGSLGFLFFRPRQTPKIQPEDYHLLGSPPVGEQAVIWLIVIILAVAFLLFYWHKTYRRMQHQAAQKKEAIFLGIDRPPAQHPIIDLSLCIGCGSCVSACPEGDVLGLIKGKATIINGLRCIGHGKCADACPVEAIQVGLGNTSHREDLPQLDPHGQTNIPGLYIIGELGGLALIKNAILQGHAVIKAIKKDCQPQSGKEVLDLLIVGAGPAGLSAALAAKVAGFLPVVLDQEKPGGTILHYPRKKLVLTQRVEIPGYGFLDREEYSKEELLAIWEFAIKKNQIELHLGQRLTAVVNHTNGFLVRTQNRTYLARKVVLALGRRGTPRKLEVPGEDQSKVMYQLRDAAHYQGDHVLVVGGGDSAVEAAMVLADQKDATVTISYRKSKFFRIKSKNENKLMRYLQNGKLNAIFDSHVEEISDNHVSIRVGDRLQSIRNDYVFIFAGGIPPFGLLKGMGIAFGGKLEEPSSQSTSRVEVSL